MSGRMKRWIWSSLQASNIQPCASEKHQQSAFVTRPSCSQAATWSTMRSPSPPLAFGTSIALKPSSTASFLWRFSISGARRPSFSSASTSCGISSSVANLKARPCQPRAVASSAMSMMALAFRRRLAEVPREHVGQVGQRDALRPLAAHGLRTYQEVEPEAVGQCREAVRNEARLHVRVAAFLAKACTDEADHVVIGTVSLRADPPVGRAEAPFAPEGEPDGELVARADAAAKIELHHRKETVDGTHLAGGGCFLDGIPVFVGEVA